MFTKILIANRGEIACRVAATARRMGVATVAVYSEADANTKHVAMCDEAVLIGPAAARDSYLSVEKILAAALASGAQAIHPGYGFLSENADFARACATAGIVFIGPPASAIDAMGSKSAAKTLMEKADVPLVPGYHGDNQDADFLQTQADKMAYPVLLKASAGGGGKGMRIVEHRRDFKPSLLSCQREAISSFGDDKVLIEKYLDRPRHIEIQVFADSIGNCVYLFERDCSVQRRHQKVLEEAPAPGMPAARRKAMGDAAVAAAKAVGYVGAGTVEFIANQDGTFYFMEMNTRLQVEHPVTEMITGLDLVEWQLRIACGEALPLLQEKLQINGHALEARIYAENPEKGFLPSTGVLTYLHAPRAAEFECGKGAGAIQSGALQSGQLHPVRIDSGVREGDAISPFYDPMIAKLIVWGPTRFDALARMSAALAEYRIVGVATNVAFLKRLVESSAFSSAQLDTGLIERNQDQLFPSLAAPSLTQLAFACCALLASEAQSQGQGQTGGHDPWASTSGWRMNSMLLRTLDFTDTDGANHLVEIGYRAGGWTLKESGAKSGEIATASSALTLPAALSIVSQHGTEFTIALGGQTLRATVVRAGAAFHVFTASTHVVLDYADPMLHAGVAEIENGRLTAPMPGKIVAIHVTKGQTVAKGVPLLVMEAMKMEHTIFAPGAGIVNELLFEIGDQVSDGAQLLMIDPVPGSVSGPA
jgi:3-methylcrotonyl-CoA carboxylase alpha subunit